MTLPIPDPYDEDAIARYAAEVLPDEPTPEPFLPEWRANWTRDALSPVDLPAFTHMHFHFPRHRVDQFSGLARRNGIARESLLRRLCAEYLIARLDEPRAQIEYDFPLYEWGTKRWNVLRPYEATVGEHERGRRRIQGVDG